MAAGGPDIPLLKKKGEKEEKEKKGGALAAGPAGGEGLLVRLGVGGGSGPALSAAGRAALGAAGAGAAARSGILPRLVNLFSSNLGLAALTALFSGAAFYGFYTFGLSPGGGALGRSVFPRHEAPSSPAAPDSKEPEGNSLNIFVNANKGTLGGDEKKPADAPAPASRPAEPKGEKAPVPSPVIPVQDAVDAVKPKMVSAPGFGSSRTVGGGGGGSPAGAGSAASGAKPGAPSANKLSDFSRAKADHGGPKRGFSPATPSKALDQLRFTSKASLQARGTSMAEGSASNATSAFEGGLGQSGNLPLVGIGYGGSGSNPNPNADGGPISSPMVLGQTSAPPVGQSSDKSPWTGALMMGVALLATASTIILIDAMIAQMAKTNPELQPLANTLAALAAALAAAAAAIGMMIMTQHGQMMQGMILVIGGGITTVAAIASLAAPPEAAPIVMVLAGIVGIAAAIGALLAMMMSQNKGH